MGYQRTIKFGRQLGVGVLRGWGSRGRERGGGGAREREGCLHFFSSTSKITLSCVRNSTIVSLLCVSCLLIGF